MEGGREKSREGEKGTERKKRERDIGIHRESGIEVQREREGAIRGDSDKRKRVKG